MAALEPCAFVLTVSRLLVNQSPSPRIMNEGSAIGPGTTVQNDGTSQGIGTLSHGATINLGKPFRKDKVLTVTETTIQNVLTRTSGFLRTVTSHSLQPYCGCSYGNSLCGVGCYVQHNGRLLRGRRWGTFLEARTNAAESYLANYESESRWARHQPKTEGQKTGTDPLPIGDTHSQTTTGQGSVPVFGPGRDGQFSIFCSSSTDPFVPQERRFRITHALLEAMCRRPPDRLILQTHSHFVADEIDLCRELSRMCDLRIHVSIETDREHFDGLPPPASPVEKRLAACALLKQAGLRTVVTVAPLLPIADPDRFFARIAGVADAVVLDHFIQGDGSADGSRTSRTPLPAAIRQLDPDSLDLSYRDRMADVARKYLPGRVGINIDGFAGRFLF